MCNTVIYCRPVEWITGAVNFGHIQQTDRPRNHYVELDLINVSVVDQYTDKRTITTQWFRIDKSAELIIAQGMLKVL